ncbi:hypothetical protein IE53DRAFT_172653 [Violaceomyces palustris]|uniref:Uncharacterized protein n=1 Tax=Violaceomyces palustris TaxID=1673888 RepID=A0ACD0NSY8_9BASI|nr:hypothetical protein IE53DRAFT_172653 [Violaceomyces palustris]
MNQQTQIYNYPIKRRLNKPLHPPDRSPPSPSTSSHLTAFPKEGEEVETTEEVGCPNRKRNRQYENRNFPVRPTCIADLLPWKQSTPPSRRRRRRDGFLIGEPSSSYHKDGIRTTTRTLTLNHSQPVPEFTTTAGFHVEDVDHFEQEDLFNTVGGVSEGDGIVRRDGQASFQFRSTIQQAQGQDEIVLFQPSTGSAARRALLAAGGGGFGFGGEDQVRTVDSDVAPQPPPSKRRRGLAGAIVDTALNAALYTGAVALTAFSIWSSWSSSSSSYHPSSLDGEEGLRGEGGGVEQDFGICREADGKVDDFVGGEGGGSGSGSARRKRLIPGGFGQEDETPSPPPLVQGDRMEEPNFRVGRSDDSALSSPSWNGSRTKRVYLSQGRRRRRTVFRSVKTFQPPSSPFPPSTATTIFDGFDPPIRQSSQTEEEEEEEMYKRFEERMKDLIRQGQAALESKAELDETEIQEENLLPPSPFSQSQLGDGDQALKEGRERFNFGNPSWTMEGQGLISERIPSGSERDEGLGKSMRFDSRSNFSEVASSSTSPLINRSFKSRIPRSVSSPRRLGGASSPSSFHQLRFGPDMSGEGKGGRGTGMNPSRSDGFFDS